ncbi:Protein CBG27092 [Caenorhabditis briggsae]|uniref:Protein CBG27092 n=1 Tax=Caenorhabditis briggsae TaxID=6238 RepID=B6IHG8_CAEBR|nr:Protein CBG27092 [Caenorhabditis briggsae]CAR99348.1 Protein CBG27092 [Caenorhabditis briggsae]
MTTRKSVILELESFSPKL